MIKYVVQYIDIEQPSLPRLLGYMPRSILDGLDAENAMKTLENGVIVMEIDEVEARIRSARHVSRHGLRAVPLSDKTMFEYVGQGMNRSKSAILIFYRNKRTGELVFETPPPF